MDKMRIHEPTTPEAPDNENYETDVWDVWKESSTCSCEGCLKIPLFASLIPLNYTESYDDSPLTSAANQFLFMSEYELNTVMREIEVAYRPFVLANAETLTHGYFDPGISRDEIEDWSDYGAEVVMRMAGQSNYEGDTESSDKEIFYDDEESSDNEDSDVEM
ncbi:hypothetical protein ACEPPN_007339 [Leptodophora sp. 'Broadleaf-Isolate-01']